MAIASDNVDEEATTLPQRWDIRLVRRFMLLFGLLSSVFDYLTFGALFLLGGAHPKTFRTGWFIESVVSAASVVLVVRSRRPLGRSRPGRGLVRATALCVLITVLLPFSPLAGPLGLAAPRPVVLLLIGAIVALYVAMAELLKRRFYAAAGRPARAVRAALIG
jgi:Mg2+-importing ATPase